MNTAKVTASITRPADTTAYAAGDVVSTAGGVRLNFTGLPDRTGHGYEIHSALLVDSAECGDETGSGIVALRYGHHGPRRGQRDLDADGCAARDRGGRDSVSDGQFQRRRFDLGRGWKFRLLGE
jgi:hypothetical protein